MISKAPKLFAEPELGHGGQFSADLLLRPLTRTIKALGPTDNVLQCFDKALIV